MREIGAFCTGASEVSCFDVTTVPCLQRLFVVINMYSQFSTVPFTAVAGLSAHEPTQLHDGYSMQHLISCPRPSSPSLNDLWEGC